eukprot:scpid92588/ scgid34146/ Mitochondrial import inner membrane translocase subunit TIM50; Small C-terminal domain Phosphatase protein 4
MAQPWRSSWAVGCRCLQRAPFSGPVRQQVRSAYIKPKEKKSMSRQATFATLGLATGMGIGGIMFMGWPQENTIGDEIRAKGLLRAFTGLFSRAKEDVTNLYESFAAPIDENLLPDVLPDHYQPPFTLVIESQKLLVNPEYSVSTGWRYRRRPGLKVFLRQVHQYYEIVIFTTEPQMSYQHVVDSLDTEQRVIYKLFREGTDYKNLMHHKDLKNLNRDLRRVIHVDNEPKACDRNPENVVFVSKWTGEEDDMYLYDLGEFLRTIAQSAMQSKTNDIRPLLKAYQPEDGVMKDCVDVFRDRRRRLDANAKTAQAQPTRQPVQQKSRFLKSF